MIKRVALFDEDHPDEPLEAEIEQSSSTELILTIPNTLVRFKLVRPDPKAPFEGSVGGRDFIFYPSNGNARSNGNSRKS
jgi:hypothetical protein